MTRPNIDAIRARVEVATEGPWEKSEALDSTEYGDYMAYGVHEVAPITQYWDSAPAHTSLEVMSAEDAEFIAHARQDVPELLAYIERLEAQIERVREALTTYEVNIRGSIMPGGRAVGRYATMTGSELYNQVKEALLAHVNTTLEVTND